MIKVVNIIQYLVIYDLCTCTYAILCLFISKQTNGYLDMQIMLYNVCKGIVE